MNSSRLPVRRIRTQWALALASLSWCLTASATTVKQMDLEELFFGSDLFGIIECEVAGEVVAEYRVVESWKGPKAGDRLRLRVPPNVWGPRVPTALVGERFLVAAYKSPPGKMMSTTDAPSDPVTWRDVRADFATPLLQGAEHFPPAADEKEPFFNSGATSLEAFRLKLAPLVALAETQQKLALARNLARSERAPAEFLETLEKAKTLDELITLTLDFDRSDAGYAHSWVVRDVLAESLPREAVLEAIDKLPPEKRGAVATRWARKPEPAPPPDLAKLRRALTTQTSGDSADALEQLPRLDCAFVTNWIVRRSKLLEENGYQIGSIFAAGCGSDRRTNLFRVATTANSRMVRAAAAVYLLNEDEKVAMPLLLKMASGDGLDAVWAALTLARRGDKTMVPRLLRALTGEPGTIDHATKWNRQGFQERLATLLSNSAKASGVPPPPLPPEWIWKHQFGPELVRWWTTNEARISLADPWLEELRGLKTE